MEEFPDGYVARLRRKVDQLSDENVLLHFELTERDELVEKLRARIRRLGLQLLTIRAGLKDDPNG